jgi:ribose 5-phosphate isomerase RpiB
MITFLIDENNVTIATGASQGRSTLAFFIAKSLQDQGFDVEIFDSDLHDNKDKYEANFKDIIKAIKEKNKKIVIRTVQVNRNAKHENH